jgi:hypothetical protein
MNPVEEIANNATGLRVIHDWLGDGLQPVSQETANRRSFSCLEGNDGKECPHLHAPRWWETYKTPIADAIKRQLEKKADMKLTSRMDEHPRNCGVCGCCMPLKVWVPTKHIAAHTSDETVKKFPAYCFQRIELENL